jgi:hypothetical protein
MPDVTGRIEELAVDHGPLLRRVVLPVTVAAALFTVFGKGLGLRIGGIAILAAVTIWTCILYFFAEQHFERVTRQFRNSNTLDSQVSQLHQHVCETDRYWKYLHDFLAELAEVANTGVLEEPTALPTTPADLGQGFLDAEKMMRELLDHLIPSDSRYVAYYIFSDRMQASPEVQNGWRRRPPDLQRDSLRRDLLARLARLGKWVVLPNVKQPAPEDEEYVPLCFDSANFQSFACLPLTVEEPSKRKATQRNGLAVGVLVIESPGVNEIGVNFCKTAVLTACDILALAFASARSNFTKERIDAKR